MNFLAHSAVLPEQASPLAHVASTLPDLWPRLPRPPLPLVLIRGLEGESARAARTVAAGIRGHLTADAAFHRHDAFAARVQWLGRALTEAAERLEPVELAAHILVELFLDAWLIRWRPQLATRYLRCFTPTTLALAAEWGAGDPVSAPSIQQMLAAIGAASFVEASRRPDGLADRFARAWARTSFGARSTVPTALIAEQLPEWEAHLEPGSAELLEDVARAVERALSESDRWGALIG